MSSMKMENLTEEWLDSLKDIHLALFFIPTLLITTATLITSPVLIACIFLSSSLRQETRYLLVANTLVADVLFLVLNLSIVSCNALGAVMPRLVCEMLTAVTVAAYCCAILTITLMVADTYVAVRWPLHYHHLLPPARTQRILVGVWVLAAVYPFSLVVVMELVSDDLPDKAALCLVIISLGFMQTENTVGVHVYFSVGAVLCTVLIVYCYARLYMVTRTQGIWQSRYSRARVTLLAHGVLLLLYFVPGLVFTVELYLFPNEAVGHEVRVWINTVNRCVFMLLPRACAPYLYGLRYREIYDTLLQLLNKMKLHLSQVTVTQP